MQFGMIGVGSMRAYADRVLSAMRKQFRGHVEKQQGGG